MNIWQRAKGSKRVITYLYARYVLAPKLRKIDPTFRLSAELVDELLNTEYVRDDEYFIEFEEHTYH